MYIILEIQKYDNGSIGTIVNSVLDYNDALNRFYTVLAAAAISQVPLHSAVLMTEAGGVLRTESFIHEAPAEEPVEEPAE